MEKKDIILDKWNRDMYEVKSKAYKQQLKVKQQLNKRQTKIDSAANTANTITRERGKVFIECVVYIVNNEAQQIAEWNIESVEKKAEKECRKITTQSYNELSKIRLIK